MKKEYYNELRDHIKNSVPEMRFVGRFNDQFNKERLEQSIDYPCCLIQFQYSNFRDSGGNLGIQEYDGLVTLHLGHTNFENQGEDVIDFAEKINKAVHTFVSSEKTIGKLMRTDERDNFDHDQVIVYEIDYSVHFHDYTADKRSTKTLTVTPVITATIETTV